MIVRDRMQTLASTITLASTARSALDLMFRHGLRTLPVVDAERHLVGLVCDHALLGLAGAGSRRPEDTPVEDVMECGGYGVHATETLQEATLRFLEDPALDVLPVVERGRVCGVLTRRAAMRRLVVAKQRLGTRSPRRDAFARHGVEDPRAADSSTHLA